tara:strand:- start:669 stop:842 length:174 start_codon:yes stop_codon:yes gene_type:complete
MKETDNRPEALMLGYLELSKRDAIHCFGNEDSSRAFQAFLAENRLSLHACVVGKLPV